MAAEVVWRGFDGSVWKLAGAGHPLGGVWLTSVSGLVSKHSRTVSLNTDGVGGRILNQVVEPMGGKLVCDVFADEHEPLASVYSRFVGAFDASREGVLSVTPGSGPTWRAPFLLESVPEPPEKSPHALQLHRLTVELPLLGLTGVWESDLVVSTATSAVVANPGTLPVHPDVVWSGSGKSVVLPGGHRVALPAVAGERVLSTNPGKGFAITDRDGSPDTRAWATLRGLACPGRVLPGDSATFGLNGCSLETRFLTDNPWR